MSQLKPLSPAAIPAALARVERYRLLGEPTEAESICHDILSVEPANREALIGLILALTDQFAGELSLVERGAEFGHHLIVGAVLRAILADRRHLPRAKFSDGPFPNIGVFVEILIAEAVEIQPTFLRVTVVASNAILIHD